MEKKRIEVEKHNAELAERKRKEEAIRTRMHVGEQVWSTFVAYVNGASGAA